jgi:hypothetical protein
MSGVAVAYSSRARGHGDAFDCGHVTWSEVGVMNDVLAGCGAPDTERRW